MKSTAKGHLKSLRYFCESGQTAVAIKACLDCFTIDPDFTAGARLVTLPLYAIPYLRENIVRLI